MIVIPIGERVTVDGKRVLKIIQDGTVVWSAQEDSA